MKKHPESLLRGGAGRLDFASHVVNSMWAEFGCDFDSGVCGKPCSALFLLDQASLLLNCCAYNDDYDTRATKGSRRGEGEPVWLRVWRLRTRYGKGGRGEGNFSLQVNRLGPLLTFTALCP